MADPTAANEQKHPAVNLTSEEKKLFSQVFQAADKDGLGVVTGDVALAFFPQRTKLAVDVLGEIWQIADVEDKGFLTPNGFYIVLRLIGYAQAGRPVNAKAATEPGPLPRFDGINTAAPVPAAAAPLQAQGSGGPIRVPPLLPDKAARYAALFEESGAQNGLLPGTTAKQIFDRAELPNDVLVRIWNLADTEMRGMLSATEFIIAMHLLASFRDGSMRALPQTLPAGLYEAAARRGAPPPRPTSGTRPGPASPTAIPRQFTGGPGRTSSPLAQQSYTAPPMSAHATSQLSTPAGDGWAINAAEKSKYDQQFASLDPSGKGFVDGNEAVGFFSNSGLSENDLAQIWDLADIRSEGRLTQDEFAVAMHLIISKVKTKGPIPSTLPANLVPPGMRNVAVNSQSAAPEFQPQAAPASKQAQSAAEDLFGLDALAGPVPTTAPAAAPQVAQSTGGSSSFATPSSPRAPGSPTQAPKSAAAATMFKPFQPSSSFGRGIVTPQATGTSGTSQPRAVPVNDDLLGDSDEVSRSLNNDSVEIGNLANQATTLSNQTQELKNKRANTEQISGQMSSQKRDLEGRLAQMRQAYEQEARDVRALEDRTTALRTENTKLQQDLALVQHSQQNLAAEHQKVAEQLATDQQENSRLKEQISQLNNEVSRLRPQIEKAKSDARHQKGLVTINKKQLANIEGERDKLKAELDSAANEHAEATRELADIQSKTEALAQEKDTHNRDLGVTRERANTASKQREEALSAFNTLEQIPAVPATAAVTSPAASINSMNPFFKRSTTQTSVDKSAPADSPPTGLAKPLNHSAFDDFFGPSKGAASNATPPPPASFGSFSPPVEVSPAEHQEPSSSRGIEITPGSEARQKIPPSPPRSRQISSSVLPLRKDALQAPSDTSSVGVAAPASRYDGSSGIATPVERPSTGAEPSKLNQSTNPEEQSRTTDLSQPSHPTLSTVNSSQANELPGAFPDETPFQTPTGTGSTNGAAAFKLAPQGTGTDPFASKPRTPASATDDFDSAFAGFNAPGKGKQVERAAPEDFPAAPAKTTTETGGEFPPIQHFENDESDSDTDDGFQDSFISSQREVHPSTGRPTFERGPSTATALPGADEQASPPSYDKSVEAEQRSHGRDSNQFPAEYKGLLPSREDPTPPPQPPHSVPESVSAIESSPPPLDQTSDGLSLTAATSAHDGGFAASRLPMPAGKSNAAPFAHSNQTNGGTGSKAGFDDFDSDFNDLSEAQAEEQGGAEDLAASIASRRDTLDEFNPTFDSPAPSTRATGTFSEPHASVGGSAFADFESSIHSGGTGAGAGSVFGTASQAPSSHDWDAMFAGIDGGPAKGASNGTSAIDEAFGAGSSGNLAPSLTAPVPSKPAFGRAISQGTEHDDPILKRLTGMGFSRDDSLKALEKYDYNIDKAADYLSSH